MDGIGLRDLPVLALIAGCLALFAFVALWLIPRAPLARTPQLVIWSVLWVGCATNLAFSLVRGLLPVTSNAIFLVLASYQLWCTWRLRDIA